jgi:MFS family permease
MSSMAASYGLMASLFLSSNAFVGVVIRLFFSGAIDRFPRGIVASAAALLTSGAVFAASIVPSETSLTLLGFVFGLGMGFGFPAHLALIADSAPRARQAQASAIMWFVIGSNFSLVPLLMGWFEPYAGASATFRAIAFFALLGASVTCLLQIPARLLRSVDNPRQ